MRATLDAAATPPAALPPPVVPTGWAPRPSLRARTALAAQPAAEAGAVVAGDSRPMQGSSSLSERTIAAALGIGTGAEMDVNLGAPAPARALTSHAGWGNFVPASAAATSVIPRDSAVALVAVGTMEAQVFGRVIQSIGARSTPSVPSAALSAAAASLSVARQRRSESTWLPARLLLRRLNVSDPHPHAARSDRPEAPGTAAHSAPWSSGGSAVWMDRGVTQDIVLGAPDALQPRLPDEDALAIVFNRVDGSVQR